MQDSITNRIKWTIDIKVSRNFQMIDIYGWLVNYHVFIRDYLISDKDFNGI